MEKYTYIAITVGKNGKYYAYAMKWHNGNNLKNLFDDKREDIIHANICETKKRATEIVAHWNECYKANGTYMFDEPMLF